MRALAAAAVKRMRPSILALQLAGNAVVGLGVAAWLQIPDSHIWQLAFSLLLAAVIVSAFFLLQAGTVRRLGIAGDLTWSLRLPISAGAALLLSWALIAYGLSTAAMLIKNDAGRRAGYFNSQLGHRWRTFLSYQHLYAWQLDAATALVWFVIPALLLPLVVESASRGLDRRSWHNSLGVLGRWQHWLSIGVVAWLILWLTGVLVGWHPFLSVRGELLSVIFRLALLYLVDVLLSTFALCIVAELLTRNQLRRNAMAQPSAKGV